MSTCADASPITGDNHNAVNRLSLPSFTPTLQIQNRPQSEAESSTSGSRWSVAERQSRSSSAARGNAYRIGRENRKQDAYLANNFRRRKQNRGSGGFLLEPTSHSSKLSRAVLSQSQQDVKGKRKSDDSDISMPKRRDRRPLIGRNGSVQSSPLSIEVKQDQDSVHDVSNIRNLQRLRETPLSQTGTNSTPASQRSHAAAVGYDIDPAQIVDMALKLSEGRRRQVSGKRYVSAGTQKERIVSNASGRLQIPTKGLNQHLISPNTPAKSPLTNAARLNRTVDGSVELMVTDDPFSAEITVDDLQLDQSEAVISRATLLRVEKAKVYMELAYEHRRLLSHLPPVGRPGFQSRSTGTLSETKRYNPLQYVRNRKLRIREKSAINAEMEGWHDIEKVRAWVDAVLNSYPGIRHDPLECIRLPPLSLQEGGGSVGQSTKILHTPPSPKQLQVKPRRPKSDWVTHPGDLIADAFWLEQGLNKTKIQDRDNNPIYHPNTPFKFSGWRNFTPVNIPTLLQQPTHASDDNPQQNGVPPIQAAPELPKFRSTHRQERDWSRGKGSKLKKALIKERGDSGKRKLSILGASTDTNTDSDISSDDNGPSKRGRKRVSREFDLPNGDPFGSPISTLYQNSDVIGRFSISDPNVSGFDSKRSSIDGSRLTNYLRHSNQLQNSSRDRGRSRGDSQRHGFFHHRKDLRDERKHGNGSTDDESATTDSPLDYALPSIAINLDVPVSRSSSPTKKSKSGLLQSLRERSKNPDKDGIEITDFAKRQSKSHSRSTSMDIGRSQDSSNENSRGTSPLTRGTNPFTNARRSSTPHESVTMNSKPVAINRYSTRPVLHSSQEQPSRIRGIFKGGRIAELLGTEVSRVGDFIWKREIPQAYRHQMSGSETSLRSSDASETDEDLPDDSALRQTSREMRGSESVQFGYNDPGTQELSQASDKPQFYNPNLPSFISPFQRDREKQEMKQDLLTPRERLGVEDHISRQAAQHRSRSKSPRLERIAPPKLDTGGQHSVGVIERKNSYGFDERSARSQSASHSHNNISDIQASRNVSAKSSIAGFTRQLRKSVVVSDEDDISGLLDRRELYRLQALLLISAVKARNLATSYNQISSEAPKLLTNSITSANSSNGQLRSMTQVRKRDHHVVAAQNYIADLDFQSSKINEQLHAFSVTTVTRLHKQIQLIEDEIENEITPRVRTAADKAGGLSVKLTTTSTQAVKSTQDVISEAFRLRRRGPFRWARLLGYTLIEWAVVGLLWFIWAVVTLVRLFIGVFRFIGKAVRWLFWID